MFKKSRSLLTILVLGLFIQGCVSAPKKPAVPIVKETLLKDICKRNNVIWRWDSVSQVIKLRLHDSVANVLVGSKIVVVDGESIYLSAPIKNVRSSIIVPSDFERKVIKRLKGKPIKKETYTLRTISEIILDPGHGGKDPGATGRTGTKEKTIVLDIAKRLRKILERNGLRVRMTRKSDNFISLKKRTEIASRSKADLFISIHANSNPVRGLHGIEVYTSKDLGYRDRNDAERMDNHRLMFNQFKMKKGNRDLDSILTDMLYTNKQAQSYYLASHIAKKTSRFVKTKNLGPKRSRFYVLRNTLIPAVLVEVGFLSNPKEEKLLKKSSYRQKIADGLAKGILEYTRVK